MRLWTDVSLRPADGFAQAVVLADSAGAARHPSRGAGLASVRRVIVAAILTCAMASVAVVAEQRVQQGLAVLPPAPPSVAVIAALTDDAAVIATITVGPKQIEWPTTVDDSGQT